MKKILTIVFSTICLNSFSQQYGASVDTSHATPVESLKSQLASGSEKTYNVKGTIKNVCQKEGCWLNLENGDGTNTLVRMKDHAFKVPKDISGNMAIVSGSAYVDTTSVEMLKHYALDEGKSQKDIDAITEPKMQVVIEATSVTVVKANGKR